MINYLDVIMIMAFQIAMIYAVKSLSNYKIKNKLYLIFGIVLYAIIYRFIIMKHSAELSTMISIFYTTIIIKLCTKMNMKNLLYYMIVVWIIAIMVDIIVMFIVNCFSSLSSNELIFKYIGTLMIVGSLLLCGNKHIKKKINHLKNSVFKLNLSYFSFLIMLLIYFVLGSVCINNIDDKGFIILVIFIAISVLIFVINFVFQQIQIISLKESIKLLNKNNEFYINLIDDYRILKHNLIGNLNGLKSVTNKKTRNLIDDLIKEYNSILKLPKNFKEIPTGINGIIYEKIYSANNPNLKIKIENKLHHNIIEVLSARKYNALCEALGVTIDNAIEAAVASKEKIIYLEFHEDCDQIIFKIINTFNGNVDLDSLGTKNYTSKNKGHGLGLFSILNKKDIKLTTCIKNNKFINIVTISK